MVDWTTIKTIEHHGWGTQFSKFWPLSQSRIRENCNIKTKSNAMCEEVWVSWVRAKVSWLPAFLIHLCPPPPFTASSSFSFSSSSSFSSYFCSSSNFHSSSFSSSSSPHPHSPTPSPPHPPTERFFGPEIAHLLAFGFRFGGCLGFHTQIFSQIFLGEWPLAFFI